MNSPYSLVGYDWTHSSFLPGDIWTLILVRHLRHPSSTTWALRLVNRYFYSLVTKKLRKYFKYFRKVLRLVSIYSLAVTSERVLVFPHPPHLYDSLRVFAFDPHTATILKIIAPLETFSGLTLGEMGHRVGPSRASAVHLLQKAGDKNESLVVTHVLKKEAVNGVLVQFFGDATMTALAEGQLAFAACNDYCY